MASNAVLVLESLRCIREGERGSEPYIWPVLIRIDDLTILTPPLVDVVAPFSGNARVVIKNDMRAGQSAAIPPSVGLLRAKLEDGLFDTHLILVVALWEEDETPEVAVRAGFQAFVSELRAALGNVSTLDEIRRAEEANDEEATQTIAKAIQDRVEKRVRSAIADTLTFGQKIAVKARTLSLDDILASVFKGFPTAVPTSFTLSLFGPGRSNEFEIQGKLEVRQVRIDRCQARVDAVRNAQSVVDDINKEIEKLKNDLQKAPFDEKPFIRDQITELREDVLPGPQATLGEALKALSICRSLVPPGFPDEAERGTGSVDEELRAQLSKSSREVVAIAKKFEVIKKDIDNLMKGLETDDRLGNFEIQR